MNDKSPRTMKTVETSWEIIHFLMESNGERVKEIAEELGLSKATVSVHLSTLEEKKYVVKNGRNYELSLYFLNIGEYVKRQRKIFTAGKDEIENLARETGGYCHLVAEEHGRAIYLHEALGEGAVGKEHFKEKFRNPEYLHSSSYGKAIMAHLSDQRIQEIMRNHDLIERTDNTITSKQELLEEMREIRDRGFALNDGEEIRGMRAVGAPILNSNEEVLGAISVSKPRSYMEGEEFEKKIPKKVVSTANIIEVNVDTSVGAV